MKPRGLFLFIALSLGIADQVSGPVALAQQGEAAGKPAKKKPQRTVGILVIGPDQSRPARMSPHRLQVAELDRIRPLLQWRPGLELNESLVSRLEEAKQLVEVSFWEEGALRAREKGLHAVASRIEERASQVRRRLDAAARPPRPGPGAGGFSLGEDEGGRP